MTVGDKKAGLTGARPRLSIVPRAAQNHGSRALEYGIAKGYGRGNYHGPAPAEMHPDPEVRKAMRLLGYLDAMMRHATAVTDAINHAIGTGGDLRAACSSVDDDAGGGKFPASMLPHLSHMVASAMIAIAVAADDELIPDDPGRPWETPRDEVTKMPIRGSGDPGYRAGGQIPRAAGTDSTEPKGPAKPCEHRSVDRGNDEYTPDRCRDCFAPVYAETIGLRGPVAVAFAEPKGPPLIIAKTQCQAPSDPNGRACALDGAFPHRDHTDALGRNWTTAAPFNAPRTLEEADRALADARAKEPGVYDVATAPASMYPHERDPVLMRSHQ